MCTLRASYGDRAGFRDSKTKALPEFRKYIVLKSSQSPPVCPSASSSLMSVEQLCCETGPGKLKY